MVTVARNYAKVGVRSVPMPYLAPFTEETSWLPSTLRRERVLS